jgi:hypothetical protein
VLSSRDVARPDSDDVASDVGRSAQSLGAVGDKSRIMEHRLISGLSGLFGFFFLGLVTLTGPATAVAHSVTFDFTGTFAAANPHSLGGIFTVPIASYPVSTISGSFTFDAEAADSNGSGTIGQYNGTLESLSFSVTKPITGDAYQFGLDLSGSSGRPVQNSITVNANGTAANQSYVMSASVRNLLPNGPILDGIDHNATAFFINLLKPGSSVFSTDVLPETPPALSPFSLYNNLTNQDGQFRLVFANSEGDVTIMGNLTSLTLATVPIPAAVYLFGTGIICLVALARRRLTQAS